MRNIFNYISSVCLIIFSLTVSATPRPIDADVIKSSDHSKTWVMPTASGTLLTSAQISASYEPTITAGTSLQYWRGDKQWQNLMADVLGTTLSGLSTASSSSVLSTDTILVGVGKLQAEVNTINTSYLSFQSNVRSASLLGLDTSDGSSVASSDSVLQAFGKLQSRSASAATSLAAKIDKSTILNKGDLIVGSGASAYDRLFYGGTNNFVLMVDTAQTLGLTWSLLSNANISNSAAVSYSKLNLTGQLLNADISASASIGRSKIAGGSANRLVVNSSSGLLQDASAITASRVLISDTNGIPTSSSVTGTTLGFLDATSSVQTQIDSKQAGIQFQDEASNLGTSGTVTSINFTGTGVTATRSTNALTVTMNPSGGGGAGDVAAQYYLSGTFATATSTPINYDTKVFDRQDGSDVSNVTTSATAWKFTVPTGKDGVYQVCVLTNHGGAGNYLRLYKNGTFTQTIVFGSGSIPNGNCVDIRLVATDFIDIRGNASFNEVGGVMAVDANPYMSVVRSASY